MEWNRVGFNSRLKRCLDERGLGKKNLAEKLKVSASAISNWQREQLPLLSQIINAAEFLNVSPGWLAFGEGAMNAVEEELIKHWRALPPDDREDLRELIARKAARTAAPKAAPKPRVSVPLTPKEHLHVATREHPDGQRVTTLDILAREEEAAYGKVRKIEKNPAIINRRHELAPYHIARHASGVAIPQWLDLAAGEGVDLELSPDFIYVQELRSHKGVHSAVIRGDSMSATLNPGDVVLLREFPDGRLELPALDTEDMKSSLLRWRSEVPDDDIYVLSINDEPPTCKRVRYSGNGDKWFMQIVGDNLSVWTPRTIGSQDKVVFFAKVIGVVEQLPVKT